MKNVITRSISGAVYVAIIVGAILGGWMFFFPLTALLGLLALNEVEKLVSKNQIDPITTSLDALAVLALLLIPIIGFKAIPLDTISICCFIYIPIYFIFRIVSSLYITRTNSLKQIALSFFSVFYIGLPLLALNSIYVITNPSHTVVLLIFIMIWLNDTGAYCFGSTLGKHRLFERLSPKKSWEGFWGGMLCCIAFGIACNYIFPYINFNIAEWILFAIIISVFSTWGDLFESMIKRVCGAKDSGNLIPGHGGILDRIDSLLLVAPATLIYILLTLFR